jgi:hypothetical protein
MLQQSRAATLDSRPPRVVRMSGHRRLPPPRTPLPSKGRVAAFAVPDK